MLRGMSVLLAICAVGCDGDVASVDAGGGDARVRDARVDDLCTADRECDDGLYCNGRERCLPGSDAADARGCVNPGADPCLEGQSCDEDRLRCIADCGASRDADGDGFESVDCGGTDCDDADATAFPGAAETCDMVDQDCNPDTFGDDGDADGDGFVSVMCCNRGGDLALRCGDDCDDMRADVHPGVTDGCGNGDEDCDTRIDEDPTLTIYPDVDGDGFGVSEGAAMACTAAGGYALNDRDCDDARADVHPGAREVCNARDDDCNAMVDDAELGCDCTDGERRSCGRTDVGDCALGVQTCVGGRWGACDGEVQPRNEVCGGGDEDCDGMTDEADSLGGSVFYADTDGDGYGDFFAPIRACSMPAGTVTNASDCNDNDSRVNPAQTGFFTEPACRDGSAPMAGPCPGETGFSFSCWACNGRLPVDSEYDYDCDGGAETQPSSAFWNCAGACLSPSPPEPVAAHPASMCGRLVEFRRCMSDSFGGCSAVREEDRLPCR